MKKTLRSHFGRSAPAAILPALVVAISITASPAFAGGPGACCFSDGTCQQLTETNCTAGGGTYQGDGTSCTQLGICPPSGACCVDTEGVDGCEQLTEAACNDAGGTYRGDGTSCTTPDICAEPTGACCVAATGCVLAVTEDECDALNGNYEGDGTTSCTDLDCATGACCIDDFDTGTFCQPLTDDGCAAAGGVYHGDGSSCDTKGICDEPPTGACCIEIPGLGTSCSTLTADDCALFGGTYQGDGTSCNTPGICVPRGACCLVVKGLNTCLQKTEDQCDLLGGSYQGDGTDCDTPGICDEPTGACCLVDIEDVDGCAQLTEDDCAAAGGTYQGDGTTCGQVECRPACCLPTGFCVEVTPTECALQGGMTLNSGATCATVVCQQPDRTDSSDKGSLLIFPKVELCWSPTGALLQDTFIDIANDFPADVNVKMYFVNGDRRILSPLGVIVEPGWNWLDNVIELTANEPTYWSAATGLPKGVSPFTVLDPGTPPGRPVHTPAGLKYVLRGFIIAFAVDELGREIRWNHLKGDAVIVNYPLRAAWEYNAYSFAVVKDVPNGQPTGTPGMLNLNGLEYARGFDQLLLDFYAVGSGALSGPGTLVTVNTDLTLHPVDADLRQETNGPITTKASFDIWNMNEVKFTGLDLCITCWDQRLLSEYGFPNHFFLSNLQTDKGRARIDGLESILCPAPGQDGVAGGANNGSRAASLLGLKMTLATFDGGAGTAYAGTNLHGVGHQAAVIKFDTNAPPPAESTAKKVKRRRR